MEPGADTSVEPKVKLGNPAFVAGNTLGKHGKKGKPLKTKRGETELEAMRWVLSNPENVTYLQREMRRALVEDRQKFLDRMLALEKVLSERLAASVPIPSPESSGANSAGLPSGQATPPAPDVGTARCVELAEALIKRLKEARGKR